MSLDFTLRLIDKATAPARQIEKSIGTVEQTLKSTGTISDKVQLAITKVAKNPQPYMKALSAAVKHLGWSLSKLAASRVIGSVMAASFDRARRGATSLLGVVRSIGSAIFSLPTLVAGSLAGMGFSKMLGGMSLKESTLTSFDVMLGGQDPAAQAFKRATSFADTTPFETTEVIAGVKQLTAAQFSQAEIFNQVLRNAGDLASGMDKPLEQVIRAFEAAKSGDFGEAFGAGMGFRALGISKQELEGAGLVFDKQGSYVGSAATALDAVNKIIEKKFGGMMGRQSKSIKGLFSTIASRPATFFFSLVPDSDAELAMDPNRFKGFVAIKDFVERLGNVLDPNSSVGGQLFNKLTIFFNDTLSSTFARLSFALEPDRVEAALDRIFNALDGVMAFVDQHGPGAIAFVKDFAKGLGDAFNIARGAWGILSPILDLVGSLIAKVTGDPNAAGGVGRVIGLVAGVAGGMGIMQVITILGLLNNITGGRVFALFERFVGFAPTVGNILKAIGGWFLNLGRMVAMFAVNLVRGFLMAIGPIGWVILAVTAIGAALVWAYNNVEWFRDGVNNAAATIQDAWMYMMDWFWQLPGQMLQVGSDIMAGLRDGIVGSIMIVQEAMGAVGDTVVGHLKSMLGINSPSRVFTWMGSMLPAGMVVGIRAGEGQVARAVAGLATVASLSAGPAMAANVSHGTQAPAAVTASAARAPGAGGTVVVEQHFHFGSAPGDAKTFVQEAGPELRRLTEEAVAEALLRLFAEEGHG